MAQVFAVKFVDAITENPVKNWYFLFSNCIFGNYILIAIRAILSADPVRGVAPTFGFVMVRVVEETLVEIIAPDEIKLHELRCHFHYLSSHTTKLLLGLILGRRLVPVLLEILLFLLFLLLLRNLGRWVTS